MSNLPNFSNVNSSMMLSPPVIAKQPILSPLLDNNMDEEFWTNQMLEHAFVLLNLLNPYEDYVFKYAHLTENTKASDYFKKLKYYHFLSKFTQDDVVNFITLKNGIICHLKDGSLKPIPNFGELFPAEDTKPKEDLIDLTSHMIKEETYYLNLLKGFLTVEQEIKFWLDENAEHTHFSIKLINPQLVSKDPETLLMSVTVKKEECKQVLSPNIGNAHITLKKSNDAALASYNQLKNMNTVELKLSMLVHEIRETAFAEKRLSLLYSMYNN
jgi:hypothetical protein